MPELTSPSLTSPKPFVFVLMPFSSDFDDTYRLAIKPACEKAGAYAERVDEQIFDGSILQRIYNQIAKADIIVSDVTGKNPNVFYETGYAHAIGKRTLLLARSTEDIPFDLKHFPHIIYGGRLSDLLAELEKRVRWHIENPDKLEATPGNILVRVNGVSLIGDAHVQAARAGMTGSIEFEIDIHNSVRRELRKLECRIGILAEGQFVYTRGNEDYLYVKSFRLDDGRWLYLPEKNLSLLPGSWDQVALIVGIPHHELEAGEHYPFAVRVFTESGFLDFPFVVDVQSAETEGSANPIAIPSG